MKTSFFIQQVTYTAHLESDVMQVLSFCPEEVKPSITLGCSKEQKKWYFCMF